MNAIQTWCLVLAVVILMGIFRRGLRWTWPATTVATTVYTFLAIVTMLGVR